jgi:hypothetical protein
LRVSKKSHLDQTASSLRTVLGLALILNRFSFDVNRRSTPFSLIEGRKLYKSKSQDKAKGK